MLRSELAVPRPVEVLLVEDDPGDVVLTQAALRSGKLCNALNVVHDGYEALQYLRRQGPYAGAVRPDLILLDLNMPRMDGRETLERIKSDPELRAIPVVILTTSDSPGDVAASYALQASCFMSKPVDLQQFTRVVQSIKDFWLCLVRYPDPPAA